MLYNNWGSVRDFWLHSWPTNCYECPSASYPCDGVCPGLWSFRHDMCNCKLQLPFAELCQGITWLWSLKPLRFGPSRRPTSSFRPFPISQCIHVCGTKALWLVQPGMGFSSTNCLEFLWIPGVSAQGLRWKSIRSYVSLAQSSSSLNTYVQ